jgi:cell division protease FtsH
VKGDPKLQWNVGYWLVAMLAFVWLQSVWQAARTVEAVPYNEFEKALSEGRVAEVVIGETTLTGREVLERCARELLAHETLDEAALRRLVQ